MSDTGRGISPDSQAHLFERFFRGIPPRGSDTLGADLGLATTREIMDRHRGYIEVESEGTSVKGATCTAWLPGREDDQG